MNKQKLIYGIASMMLCVSENAFAQRDTITIDSWQFSRSSLNAVDATQQHGTWKNVIIPHDFQIEQPWVAPSKEEHADNSDQAANVKSRLSARGFKEMGIGWYRKSFTPGKDWKGKRAMLEFGGIMLVGDVYLNGERIGGTEYGYIGFGIDITDKIKYGSENILVVKADTRKENNSRWYTGGGLFRTVKLILTDKQLYFSRHPLYITTKDNNTVNIKAEIFRFNKQKNGNVKVRILDAKGNLVAEKDNDVRFSQHSRDAEYKLEPIHISNANLWDIDSPYLYMAEVSVYDENGKITDKVTEQFGIRTIEFSPAFGFKLNGKKVMLKGIANHNSLGALGSAAYPRAIEKRIKLLKEFGFNHIRCSHNPYSEELYQLCDKYGILVVDEVYDKWLTQYSGGRESWSNHWQYDIPEWIERDRNHPSVILWSLGNELQTYPDLPFNDWGVTPYRLLKTLLNRYDSTRLTTVAMHPRGRNWETDSLPCDLAMITDIQAYNYRYMYFPGDGRRFPNMIFYQSEANMPMMGPNYYEMNLDKVVGLAYWGMIDYLGESLGWPKKGWDNGVFDISLEPKPQAYFLKSIFSDKPVVHIGIADSKDDAEMWNGVKFDGDRISDHWNRKPGNKYTVYTYTNADEVELYLNGRSLGIKKNSFDPKTRNKIKWTDVEYQKGTLEAVARTNGKIVARHKIETAGKPKELQLIPDVENWKADGNDLMHVRILAVDHKGLRSPMANSKLMFDVSSDADIIGVCNGDISSEELTVGNSRRLYNGSAMVILRSGKKSGKVKLKVSGQGYKTKTITLYLK
ncbi:beta-galactosidase [Prevotella herbatica]|uniref:Beta-galactosidase n=1 Tax=Prevotella herbatica TaxID=2801997 RepID=A0ABN6EGM1_9BACT|nr:glycoside hydrolase family 2 TIM barrel-domain containing protein [Prevotella herbatica]BCS85058.1 beta-galactosidase [Prevotella herbatica]